MAAPSRAHYTTQIMINRQKSGDDSLFPPGEPAVPAPWHPVAGDKSDKYG